jgi:hypothetical protein
MFADGEARLGGRIPYVEIEFPGFNVPAERGAQIWNRGDQVRRSLVNIPDGPRHPVHVSFLAKYDPWARSDEVEYAQGKGGGKHPAPISLNCQ